MVKKAQNGSGGNSEFPLSWTNPATWTGASQTGHHRGCYVSYITSAHHSRCTARSKDCPQISTPATTSSRLFCAVGQKKKKKKEKHKLFLWQVVNLFVPLSLRGWLTPALPRHGQDLACKAERVLAALGDGFFCRSGSPRYSLTQPDFIRTKPTLMQG